jgi:hypothetical protein
VLIAARIDLGGYPTPSTKLDLADHVFLDHALRAVVLAVSQIEAHRSIGRADDWDRRNSRPHHGWRPSKHPNRGHQPLARPSRLVEEVLKVSAIDLAIPATERSDGEAMNRRVRDQ